MTTLNYSFKIKTKKLLSQINNYRNYIKAHHNIMIAPISNSNLGQYNIKACNDIIDTKTKPYFATLLQAKDIDTNKIQTAFENIKLINYKLSQNLIIEIQSLGSNNQANNIISNSIKNLRKFDMKVLNGPKYKSQLNYYDKSAYKQTMCKLKYIKTTLKQVLKHYQQ